MYMYIYQHVYKTFPYSGNMLDTRLLITLLDPSVEDQDTFTPEQVRIIRTALRAKLEQTPSVIAIESITRFGKSNTVHC